jgi:hypothetical protein
LNSFKPGADAALMSPSNLLSANATQSSGGFLGSSGLKTAKSIVDTLASPNTTPIGGAVDNFSTGGTGQGQMQYGDVLNAFGGSELSTPNPGNYRIDSAALDRMLSRLDANSYLQNQQARDEALPAGQYEAPLNSPYANRLSNIQAGSKKSYEDLLSQADNANKYFDIIDSNPGLTQEQFNEFLGNQNTNVLGNFQIPENQLQYLRAIKAVGPLNNSLIRTGV